jgi:dihydrofolate reductase
MSRKLIVTSFVSLDGVAEAPGGEPGYAHTGWVGDVFSDELASAKVQEQLETDVLLLGRVTYESFVDAWPSREGPLADKINTMRKVVVSGTIASSDWHDTSFVSGDVGAAVRDLKAEDGAPILVVGSRTLAQFLLLEGLVDQLNLTVVPVILGSGFRLFPESPDKRDFELLSSRTVENGVQLLELAPR